MVGTRPKTWIQNCKAAALSSCSHNMRHMHNLHLMCPDTKKLHVSWPVDCQNVPMAQMFCTLSMQKRPHAGSPALTVQVLKMIVVDGNAVAQD